MFFWSISLFLIAIIIIVLDIFFEIFGIIGLVGVVVLLASMFLTYNHVPNGDVIVLVKILTLIPLGFIVAYYFKKKQIHHKIFLNEALAEDSEGKINRCQFLHQEGKTITALRPYGHADFNGTRVEVRSESDYILAGQLVTVAYIKENTLFVRPVDNAK